MPYVPQTRIIERRGVLIPTDEEREAKQFLVFADVIAHPLQYSANFRPRIPKTFYGYAQVLWNRRVIVNLALEYFNQLIIVENRSSHQLAADLKCVQRELNQSIGNLGQLLGVTYTITDGFQHSYPEILWDRIVFQIEDGWLLQVSTRADELERCDPDDAPAQDAPGAPAVPAPQSGGVPGSNGLPSRTAPYNPATEDNGDTYVPPFLPPGVGGGTTPSADPDGRYRCSTGGVVTGNGGSYADPQQSYVQFGPGVGVFFPDGPPAAAVPGGFQRISFPSIVSYTIAANSMGNGASSGGQAEWDAAGIGSIFALQLGWSIQCNS